MPAPSQPADVTLLGARNLDPPEVEFIAAAGVRTELGRAAGAHLCRRRRRRARSTPSAMSSCRSPDGIRARTSWNPCLPQLPGRIGAGLHGVPRARRGTRHRSRGWGTRSACNRSGLGSGLTSADVRGAHRRPGRAQRCPGRSRPAASEHVPQVRLALSRRRARRDALGSARSAGTTSRCARARGSTGTRTTARSPRSRPTFAPTTR